MTSPNSNKSAARDAGQFRKNSKVLCIIPPSATAMMTGTWRVQRAHDLTTCDYEDGSRESAIIPLKRWKEIEGNYFSIIGEIQARAAIARAEGRAQ